MDNKMKFWTALIVCNLMQLMSMVIPMPLSLRTTVVVAGIGIFLYAGYILIWRYDD